MRSLKGAKDRLETSVSRVKAGGGRTKYGCILDGKVGGKEGENSELLSPTRQFGLAGDEEKQSNRL